MGRGAGWSRRRFMRALGLGGAAAAGALATPRWLTAQETVPRRMVVFYTGQDHLQALWRPPVGDATDAALTELSPQLSALSPFADRIVQVHGVRGAHGHITGHAEALSGTPGGDPLPSAFPSQGTLDQFFAARHAGETSTASLQLAMVRGRNYESVISYLPGADADALPIPLWPQQDPRVAFERVFRALSPTAARDLWRSRRSVLDHTVGQLGGLRDRAGGDESRLLEQHLESVRELERRLGDEDGGGATVRSCETPSEPTPELDAPSRLRAHLDLTVAALACDLTRSVSIVVEPGQKGIDFDWLEAEGVAPDEWLDWHEISHGGARPVTDAGAPNKKHAMHRAVHTWHAEELAHLLAQLDAVPDGDGTLLDHTMVLWVSELGLTRPDQNNPHLRSDVPLLVAGGSAGTGLRMGRYLDLQDEFHYHDVLLTLGRALGLERETFGDRGTSLVETLLA